MVGLERSTLPLIGRQDFHLASSAAVLSFIVAFGVAKALTNLGAGALAARAGRRRLLIAGWAVALPVPLLIATAPSWAWIVAANVLLGINQGLAWSMTVVMKIDLVGPRRRGLALGLNEAAGYGGVALAAGLSGWLASQFAARDVLVIAGAAIAIVAFLLSVLFVRDTAAHVALEQARHHPGADETPPRLREAFARATWRVPALRSCSQAGLVNNLNDGLAWGLVPLYLAAHGATVAQIGLVAAVYPGVWAVAQIGTGHWSDTAGRKPLIVAGMLLQAAALGLLALSAGAVAIATGAAVLLGLGTALVYPTLIAAMSDAVSPVARAPVVGVYRFWRDLGLRARRRDRRCRRRRARLQRRDRDRRRPHRRIRALGGARHARTSPQRKQDPRPDRPGGRGDGDGAWRARRMNGMAVRAVDARDADLRSGARLPTCGLRLSVSGASTDDAMPGNAEGPLINVLVIVNDQPYGSERPYNALRLAGSLAKPDDVALRVFLLGDAVGCAVAGQQPSCSRAQCVRDCPDQKVKLILVYLMTTGRNFDEVLGGDRLAAVDRQAHGRDARQLARGRGCDHLRLGLGRRGGESYPQGWTAPRPCIRIVTRRR